MNIISGYTRQLSPTSVLLLLQCLYMDCSFVKHDNSIVQLLLLVATVDLARST